MKLGIDCIEKHLEYFANKRIGLITNPTGFTSDFKSTIDYLKEKVNLVALFSPEHGVRGNLQDGEKVLTYIDEASQVKVYSLYGGNNRPTQEMFEEIDILCIDVQDAGSRFYTYITTMAYSMEACKLYNKQFVVFDRPNPVNGIDVEGNILDIKYRSFIGHFPIVQRHGMTIGELAILFNEEYGIDCDLKVILMEGWARNMYYEDTNLLWIMPSPNFPTIDTAIVYNATCIFEGTNVSEGRGTTLPFEVVGAPYINPYELAKKLNSLKLEGVYFRPLFYTPTYSKYALRMCGGVQLHILNRNEFKAVKVGWTMLKVIQDMYPNDYRILSTHIKNRPRMLEFNTGSSTFTEKNLSFDELYKILEEDTEKFKKIRTKYLLY